MKRLFTKLGSAFLLFLEIIGLRRRRALDSTAQIQRFKRFHAEFRKLLTANNSFLEVIADLEQKVIEHRFLDQIYIKRKVIRAIADIHTMIESLNIIAEEKYAALREVFDRISKKLTEIIVDETLMKPVEIIMDLPSIYSSHADVLGGKMARLGEIRNVLQIPTPDGFAITTNAFRLLFEEAGLRSLIHNEHLEIHSQQDIKNISETLQCYIKTLKIPQELEKVIYKAYDRLTERSRADFKVSVRSSAMDEDSDLSFAGQFFSALNVSGPGLTQAYLHVLTSLYGLDAMHYRFIHQIPGESAEMAVGVVQMVDAISSGVVYSRDPIEPESEVVLIHAVKGIAVSFVEGEIRPEIIRVVREQPHDIVARSYTTQGRMLISAPANGLEERVLTATEVLQPCLSDEEARQLTRWAVQLENHFGAPQDIEWAMSADHRIYILQSRSLHISQPQTKQEQILPGYRVLLQGGDVACPGIGIGPAVHMDENDDLDAFPTGAILVAPRSSPKFVRVMSKARAIVTNAGSTTGHMASLARELRLPTLLNIQNATQLIPEGLMITVDVKHQVIYQGEVPILKEEMTVADKDFLHENGKVKPEFDLLEKVLGQISPLWLTNPRTEDFKINRCQSFHDIARFIHEKSYAEMFNIGEQIGDARNQSYRLDVFLPIDLFIIDLGDGLKANIKGRSIKPSAIISKPLKALLKGMLQENIPRSGAKPMDVSGLLNIMMRHAVTNPEADATFWAPSYALISDSYLNYTARVGYHFSIVDTYCSPSANKNYISILFRGGAADTIRRHRRAKAIGEILRNYGFSIEINHDTVSARQGKGTMEECLRNLEMIGRLFQFFRQLDAAMITDESITFFKEAFLRGDYGLDGSSDFDHT